MGRCQLITRGWHTLRPDPSDSCPRTQSLSQLDLWLVRTSRLTHVLPGSGPPAPTPVRGTPPRPVSPRPTRPGRSCISLGATVSRLPSPGYPSGATGP